MSSLTEIKNSIEQLHADIRAEVVISLLFEAGMQTNECMVHHQGVFKRAYRKDLVSASLSEINQFQEWLSIYLSRDGMYDLLPEGIFHQSHKGSNQSVGRMVSEHKRFKQEELEARKFFAPFENEFFIHRTDIEKKEKAFLRKITIEKNRLLTRLWKLDKTIPENAAKKILEFLPQINQIFGKPMLMKKALEKILDEPVDVKLNYIQQSFESQNQGVFDELLLGNNTVTGSRYSETIPEFEFILGPFIHLRAEQFLPNMDYDKVIQIFFEYFVPMEAEIKTTFIVQKIKKETEEAVLLGYNFEL